MIVNAYNLKKLWYTRSTDKHKKTYFEEEIVMSSKTHRYIQIGDAVKLGMNPEELVPNLTQEEMDLYYQLTSQKAILNGHCDFCRDYEVE